MILTEANWTYRLLLERLLAQNGVRLPSPMEFHSVEAIKQCVMSGIGMTFLPQVAVANEIKNGQLIALPWAGDPVENVTQVVWHKDKWVSPALQAFLDVTRAVASA